MRVDCTRSGDASATACDVTTDRYPMRLVTLLGRTSDWSGLGAIVASPSLTVQVLDDVELALAPFILETTNLFVIDIDMEGLTVEEFIRAVLQKAPATPVLIAARSGHPQRLAALEAGAAGLLRTPIDSLEFVAAVHGAMRKARPDEDAAALIMDRMPVKMAVLDENDQILFANREASRFWGAQYAGKPKLPSADALRLAALGLQATERNHVWSHLPLGGALGHPIPHLTFCNLQTPVEGEPALRLVIALPDEKSEATWDAIDSNMALPNLATKIAHAACTDGAAAVHLLEIRNLAEINGRLGRIVGDRLLQTIRQRLAQVARSYPCEVFRISGDEFAVMQGARKHDDIVATAHHLLAIVGPPVDIAGTVVEPAIRIGVACFPRDGNYGAALLRAASAAKQDADATIVSSSLAFASTPSIQDEPSIEAAFVDALLGEDLQFFYQPQVDLSTGKYTCLEALLRWPRGAHGDVSPKDILDIARRKNLLAELTLWMVKRLGYDRNRMVEAGLSALRIAVHLSHDQLELANLLAKLQPLKADETCAVELLISSSSIDHQSPALAQLRENGFDICLQLIGLPEELIDIAPFVSRIKLDARQGEAMSSAIGLARNLMLPITAANVEEASQLVQMREAGCSSAQGYYIQPPISLPDLISMLRRHPWG